MVRVGVPLTLALDLDQLLDAVYHVVAPLCIDVAHVARVQVPG